MNRSFAIILATLLVLPAAAFAQLLPCSPPNSLPGGTLPVQVDIRDALGKTASTDFQVTIEVSINGHVSYQIDISTIQFRGDGSVVNSISTADLFKAMGKAAVLKGVQAGRTPCGACTAPSYTEVRQPACVFRSGSGLQTQFSICAPGCSERVYSVCCPSPGITDVQLVSASSSGCNSSQCDSTL